MTWLDNILKLLLWTILNREQTDDVIIIYCPSDLPLMLIELLLPGILIKENKLPWAVYQTNGHGWIPPARIGKDFPVISTGRWEFLLNRKGAIKDLIT